jgi:hypothetical protein
MRITLERETVAYSSRYAGSARDGSGRKCIRSSAKRSLRVALRPWMHPSTNAGASRSARRRARRTAPWPSATPASARFPADWDHPISWIGTTCGAALKAVQPLYGRGTHDAGEAHGAAEVHSGSVFRRSSDDCGPVEVCGRSLGRWGARAGRCARSATGCARRRAERQQVRCGPAGRLASSSAGARPRAPAEVHLGGTRPEPHQLPELLEAALPQASRAAANHGDCAGLRRW